MDPNDFKRTRELFDAALERSPDERRRFLEEACGSNTDLLEHVGRLLNHSESDGVEEAETHGQPSASVGMTAPSFDMPCVLQGGGRGWTRLSDYRGRWLVMVFYPRDFSLICPTEIRALSNRIDEFRAVGAEVLGISVDSIDTHERWLRTPKSQGGLGACGFALASDANGIVSRAFGIYLELQHVSLRGVFIVDPNGVVQFQAVHNLSVGRRSEDILRVIAALQTGGLCAEDWTPGLDTIDPAATLGAGTIISHYEIEALVGSGSFGSVFRARDLTLERAVAIKVIKGESPTATTVVLDEARAAAALSHANICTVFAVDDSEGIPFIAMEYVQGRPLSDLIGSRAMLKEQAADIGHQIAAGMAAAHAQGITHGDLKPANVVVRDDGVAKILDFGLARSVDAPECTSCGVRGTPAYMAPEQAAGGRATPASDVFSLGVILYELLTGRGAFMGSTITELLDQVQAVDPDELAASLQEPFSSLLRRTLVRDNDARTITMGEIAGVLAEVKSDEDQHKEETL